MSSTIPQTFSLGPWTVEPLRGAVFGQNGETHHLEPKVMDVLVCLADHYNQIVSREHLLETAWSGSAGSDEQLTRAICELRRAFHDEPTNPKYIETVPKRGYRLIGKIDYASKGSRDSKDIPAGVAARSLGRMSLFFAAALLVLALAVFVVKQPAVIPSQEATLVGDKSIAVLPFVNLSDDPRNEYFSDGLSEEILTLLVRIPGLKVIARTSSFSFKGKNEDLRVIGKKLGVTTLLEGSVRKSGQQLRITVQLVDVSDGTNIWSETYDRTMTDIFTIQDDIAAAIVDALKLHIGVIPSRGRPTEVAEAYALFLRAKVLLNMQQPEAAESILQQVITLDPDFAEAHELLALHYWTEYARTEAPRLMRESAARALAIDSDLVLARALYLYGSTENFSLPEVIEAFVRAARERPNDPAVLRTVTWELLITGYLGEALQAAERFVEVDPLSAIAHIRHSAALAAVGRHDDSVSALQVAAQLNHDGLDWYFGELALKDGRDETAVNFFHAVLIRSGVTNTAWVDEMVGKGRNPTSGQAYLDERIPVVVATLPPDVRSDYHSDLNRWYLFFGHLDRYFDFIMNEVRSDPMHGGDNMNVWYGTLNRTRGFTGHPRYLEVANILGFVDVWEHRGPPDFCTKVAGAWTCE